MPYLTRRRLLTSAGALATAAFGADLLPASVQRAMATAPGGRPHRLADIKHVVILMQENRSFDHYFGTLPGVRGFSDPQATRLSSGRSVFHQPDPANPDGYLLPFRLNTSTTSAQTIPTTDHEWPTQHAAWNGGAMDNWVPAHRAADGANGPYTMGYYTREDIPFHYALAEAFTICDRYHSSVMGPTWPNRMYLMSGTIDPDGRAGGPILTDKSSSPLRWPTYPEALTKAGVSWKVYQEIDSYACNVLEYFQAFQDAPTRSPLYENGLSIDPAGQFEYDAARGRLPTISWLIPTSYQSEHPHYTPAAGAAYIASKISAIAANPELWATTVFILTYDENDGLFDHVPPPTPPGGTPGEYVHGQPIGAGFRVPCIIVSPWTRGGWIAGQPFDHTSVLRFCERVTGVKAPNLSAWRRSTFGDLTSAFQFGVRTPPPHLPAAKPGLLRAYHDIAHLPPPQLPTGHQRMPIQRQGPRPRRLGAHR